MDPERGVERSVSYLDHNLLYIDFKTPDDHIYLQSVAKRYGVTVSRPGNGICHTVHVARFGRPGLVILDGGQLRHLREQLKEMKQGKKVPDFTA